MNLHPFASALSIYQSICAGLATAKQHLMCTLPRWEGAPTTRALKGKNSRHNILHGNLRTAHLEGQAQRLVRRPLGGINLVQSLQQDGALVPRHVGAPLNHVVPLKPGDGHKIDLQHSMGPHCDWGVQGKLKVLSWSLHYQARRQCTGAGYLFLTRIPVCCCPAAACCQVCKSKMLPQRHAGQVDRPSKAGVTLATSHSLQGSRHLDRAY